MATPVRPSETVRPTQSTGQKTNTLDKVNICLVAVERDVKDHIIATFYCANETDHPVAIPNVRPASDGLSYSIHCGFEVLRSGKWTNPGYYTEGIPLPLIALQAHCDLMFSLALPSSFWRDSEEFRLVFGDLKSSPARIDDFVF